MFRFLFIALLVGLSQVGKSQNIDRLQRAAQKVFYKEDFVAAKALYGEILTVNPTDKQTQYHYLISHLLTDGKGESIDSLLAFQHTIGKKDKFFPYWLGRIYFINYDAQHALKYFKIFLSSKALKSDEIVEETKNFYANAELLLYYLRNPDDYEIHLVDGINSKHDELSPVFFKSNNELLFVSSAPPGTGEPDGKYRVYHTTYSDSVWLKPEPLLHLGEFSFEDANLEVVDEDGKLFMYNKKKGGDLFFSEPGTNGWTTPQEFDSQIASTHMQSHFFINSSENRIIFASGKLKTQGLDLYESYRDPDSGKWSEPQPLDGLVNSVFNEDSPFLSVDETTIYFSSDRTGYIGGYDVFKSTYNDSTKTWGEPVNLGFPINSPDDEFYFKMNENLEEGYFSSNRIHGAGSFDIYYFWEIEKTNIAGSIIDASSGKPVEGAQIKFHPSSYYDESFTSFTGPDGKYGNQVISDEIFTVEIFDRDEKMIYNSLLQVKAEGGLAVTVQKNFRIGESGTQELHVVSNLTENPKPATEGLDFVADAKEKKKTELLSVAAAAPVLAGPTAQAVKRKKLIRPNLYYDKSGIYYQAQYQPLLNKVLEFLEADPSLVIEIAGHTDNAGNPSLNMLISQKRALAVQTYLLNKGISPDRLKAKGYGESRPMASNDQELEGRELNRRVEFLVISGGNNLPAGDVAGQRK